MTNFILREPRIVFVHLPKTGGTSVRKALGGDVEGRFFGHIPDAYTHLDSFAVVREPKARFLSAYRMFKFGNKLDGDYYSEPRWPDLTITQALDVLEDPWIGFDRSQRTLTWNFKHHIVPQTHPFNCLAYAKSILRFEFLEDDFARLCSNLHLSSKLPNLRSSRGQQQKEEEWSQADKNRFHRLFENDYRELGYALDIEEQEETRPIQIVVNKEAAEKSVFKIWSAYFSDKRVFQETASEALPPESCALEPFADEVIPGSPASTWAGRSKDLIDHFHKLQPEFSGASRLSHLLACIVVVLRRDAECKRARVLFWRILDEQFDVIRSELSLRWLVAISDTVADFGRNSGECAIGMSASVYANSTKLHESELRVFYPKRPWPPKKRMNPGGELFDGLITFWTEKGDLMENMFARSQRVADLEPTAGKVLMEVIERLRTGSTVYRRFARISGEPSVPILEDEPRKKVQRLIAKKL